MTKYITPAERVAELVAKYGSYRAAGDATGIAFSHLCAIANGKVLHPVAKTADLLGLDIVYRRKTGA